MAIVFLLCRGSYGIATRLLKGSYPIWIFGVIGSSLVIVPTLVVFFGIGILFSFDMATAARWYSAIFVSFGLCMGGIVAYKKLEIFRDFEPNITVSHRVSHRPMGAGYRVLTVTTDLRNYSKVSTLIQSGYFKIYWLAPYSTAAIESITEDARIVQKDSDTLMTIGDLSLGSICQLDISKDLGIIIEPGEIHSETYNFPLRDDVLESVFIETFFENPQWVPESSSARFWGTRSAYDFKDTDVTLSEQANSDIN